MRVSVRFLSYLGSLIGARQVEFCLPEAARIADLAQRLQEAYPEHASLLAQVRYLVNRQSTTPETELVDGAQVLVLLSLSGG